MYMYCTCIGICHTHLWPSVSFLDAGPFEDGLPSLQRTPSVNPAAPDRVNSHLSHLSHQVEPLGVGEKGT